MKSPRRNRAQINSRRNCPAVEDLRPYEIEITSNPSRGPKKAHKDIATYEEGDLRGIVAKTKAESIDPYRALLEAGVIKNASEFFNQDDK